MGNMLQKICGITEHKMAIKDIRIHIDGFDLDEVFGDVPFDDLVALGKELDLRSYANRWLSGTRKRRFL